MSVPLSVGRAVKSGQLLFKEVLVTCLYIVILSLPAFHWEGRKTSFNLEHVCTISSCLVSLYALELIVVRDYLKIKSELWPGDSALTYTQEM